MGHIHEKHHLTPITTSVAVSDLVCSTFASLPLEKSFAARMPNGLLHKWPACASQALLQQSWSDRPPSAPFTQILLPPPQHERKTASSIIPYTSGICCYNMCLSPWWGVCTLHIGQLLSKKILTSCKCCFLSFRVPWVFLHIYILKSRHLLFKTTDINWWWTPADKNYNSLKFYPNSAGVLKNNQKF